MFYMNLVDYPCCPPGMTWGLLYLNHVAYSDPLKDVGWGGAPPWFKRKPGFQNPVSCFPFWIRFFWLWDLDSGL